MFTIRRPRTCLVSWSALSAVSSLMILAVDKEIKTAVV
jgi:hypothetical protein